MSILIRKYGSFIKKLSLKKSLNALMLVFEYVVSKKLQKFNLRAFPAAVAFEPTTSCNLRCPECPSGLRSFTRPTGMLNMELFKKTISELKDRLLYLTFYFQGEPYLHKNFLKMVEEASKANIYTSTSTNAHYLDPTNAEATVKSGLDKIIISIDGTSQDTYESYRIGGQLSKVIEGTQNLIAAKKKLNSATPFITFQFLVVKPNEQQIPEIKKLAKEMGVDELKLKTAQIYDYENGSELIPTDTKYARYTKNKVGKYEIKNTFKNKCWKMWHSCVITWDGTVVACCFDKDAENPLGSLKKYSFKEVWNNIDYQDFRKKISYSRKEIDICKNCTEGTVLWG